MEQRLRGFRGFSFRPQPAPRKPAAAASTPASPATRRSSTGTLEVIPPPPPPGTDAHIPPTLELLREEVACALLARDARRAEPAPSAASDAPVRGTDSIVFALIAGAQASLEAGDLGGAALAISAIEAQPGGAALAGHAYTGLRHRAQASAEAAVREAAAQACPRETSVADGVLQAALDAYEESVDDARRAALVTAAAELAIGPCAAQLDALARARPETCAEAEATLLTLRSISRAVLGKWRHSRLVAVIPPAWALPDILSRVVAGVAGRSPVCGGLADVLESDGASLGPASAARLRSVAVGLDAELGSPPGLWPQPVEPLLTARYLEAERQVLLAAADAAVASDLVAPPDDADDAGHDTPPAPPVSQQQQQPTRRSLVDVPVAADETLESAISLLLAVKSALKRCAAVENGWALSLMLQCIKEAFARYRRHLEQFAATHHAGSVEANCLVLTTAHKLSETMAKISAAAEGSIDAEYFDQCDLADVSAEYDEVAARSRDALVQLLHVELRAIVDAGAGAAAGDARRSADRRAEALELIAEAVGDSLPVAPTQAMWAKLGVLALRDTLPEAGGDHEADLAAVAAGVQRVLDGRGVAGVGRKAIVRRLDKVSARVLAGDPEVAPERY